jgi:hypothetical protein
MSILNFPRCKPPFLEIVAEAVDGYTHAIVWRDERYRRTLFWRGHSHAEAVDRINGYAPSGGITIIDHAMGAA